MNEVEIGAFHRRELEGQRFVECVEHIAVCDDCRGKLALRKDLVAAKLQLENDLTPLVEHISEKEVQQYVTGRLSVGRIREIDGHLARCSQCAAEIRDLRDFVATQPTRAFSPPRWFMVAASAALVAIVIAFVSLRRPHDVVSLNDGQGRISLDEHGVLNGAGALGSDEKELVKRALIQQRLSFPASLVELQEQPGTLMGVVQSAPFQLGAPIGTAVRSNRPALSWNADPESAGYKVTVKDQNAGTVIQSGLLQTTSWTIPRDLEGSHIYVWQVASLRSNKEVIAPQPPAAPAKFMVLDASANSKLLQLPPSHLVRAVLYANAGLLDDAYQELDVVQKANPQSALVQHLSDQLRQTRASQ